MNKFWKVLGKTLLAVLSLGITAVLVCVLFTGSGSMTQGGAASHMDAAIMDRYDMYINNRMSNALEGVLSIDKVYWLSDNDLIAPEPDQNKYGSTNDPSTLGWLMEEAAEILDGQETVFHPGITIAPGTEVIYYLDETIFAVTWKQVVHNGMYTFSEVKIAHPSQLRRFLAGGEYGSEVQLVTTEMARTVNAVVASSGDFYGFRQAGVIVYDGQVRRIHSKYVDTCYIDDQGNMLFSYAGQLPDMKSAQKFVDENNIRFSLAFGPVIIDNGDPYYVEEYSLGQIEDRYARAALCQKDDLHYVVVAVNSEGNYKRVATLYEFSEIIQGLDVKNAYTLDGGQTAVIVMNDKRINSVVYGSERQISDIFYFATAVPNGG